MSFPDLRVEPDTIIITNGSQQALDLIGKLFVEPGSCVMTSEPTYLGALQAWNAYQACYIPLDRRLELVRIAREHDLILVEDDPYGELRFEGEPITHCYRLAPERTFYLSTFSKTLAPGLRIGWVATRSAARG